MRRATATAQVLTEHGCLRWCPVHQLALTHSTYEGWHWHPLSAATVHIALSWAGACGLDHAITVEVTNCPQCSEPVPVDAQTIRSLLG